MIGVSDEIVDGVPIEWKTARRIETINKLWEDRCELGEFDGLTHDEQIDAWASYNAELICAMEDGIILKHILGMVPVLRQREWKRLSRAKKQRRARCGRK